LAVDADFPGVAAIGARQDLDQRRLAGAVVAEEANHLAAMQVDGGLIHRADTAERDGDIGHFDQWRAGVQHWRTPSTCSDGRACPATPRKPKRCRPRSTAT